MFQSPTEPAVVSPTSDRFTLIALSALAYIAAVALHEHLGHTLACLALGGHPVEVGAFYVNCDYRAMSDLSIRLVALAGPLVSLLIGLVSFLSLRRVPPHASSSYYFVWLLGSLGLMSASGYLLFSGIAGIGDLGTTPDSFFYQVTPEWLWRVALTVAGLAAYLVTIRMSVREIDQHIGGEGPARIRSARQLALASYLTGAVVSIGIGLLNPHGLVIVVTSALASSLGGSSGLLWMMQWLDRTRQVALPGLVIERNWRWIIFGCVITVVYALVLGPTLRF